MRFGLEFIIDLKGCDVTKFTRKGLSNYLINLCNLLEITVREVPLVLLEMHREDLHFWDYEDDPEAKAAAPAHLDGTSAIQFIRTSNITIHTLDKVGEIYINVFSCKDFNHGRIRYYTLEYFGGTVQNEQLVHRGTESRAHEG